MMQEEVSNDLDNWNGGHVNRVGYELSVESMEESHLRWMIKFLPKKIRQDEIHNYPQDRLWAYGAYRNGEYFIDAIGALEYMDEVEGIYVTEIPRDADYQILRYKSAAPCWQCNADYDDDTDEDTDAILRCEVCSAEGWIYFDCIGEPGCSAVEAALEVEEFDGKPLTEHQINYIKNLS